MPADLTCYMVSGYQGRGTLHLSIFMDVNDHGKCYNLCFMFPLLITRIQKKKQAEFGFLFCLMCPTQEAACGGRAHIHPP